MSLLLDALRKSEQRRQNGGATSLGLPTGAAAGERTSSANSGRRWWLILVGVLAFAALLAAVWWALGHSDWLRSGPESASDRRLAGGESEHAPPLERALQADEYRRPEPDFPDRSVSGDIAATTDGARAPGSDGTPVPPTPGEVTLSSLPAASVSERPSGSMAIDGEPAIRAGEPEIRPDPPASSGPDLSADTSAAATATRRPRAEDRPGRAPDSEQVLASLLADEDMAPIPSIPGPDPALDVAMEDDPRDNTIDPWELPASLRSEFPGVDVAVHVFAPDPSARFVLIAGERYGEGDMVADGVRLEEIARGGVIVEFRDYRIWIE